MVLVDRISALPNFILGDILSFLPTKEAVATSILSERWKLVWMTIHNLDFYRYSFLEQYDMKFIEFVNRVLNLHDGGPLNKFHLFWMNARPLLSSHVSSWITTAITRNIQELSLFIDIRDGKLEVPCSVLNCVSLRCLKLNRCSISGSTSSVFCLPRLKPLKLISVQFRSKETFEKLISRCPMLNYLYLQIDHGDFTYTISSTSLRRLKLFCKYDCGLILEASSLDYLKLNGCLPKIFVLLCLSSYVEVDFQISSNAYELSLANICDSIVEAVSAFDCAKALTLSANAMWALSRGTIKLSTKFKRLVKLETSIRYCDWSSLQDLIQDTDNLEVLTVNQCPYLLGVDLRDCLKWTSPAEVPRCLSNSLKKVVFNGYYDNVEDELGMICYILKHESALEVMHISRSVYGDKKKI